MKRKLFLLLVLIATNSSLIAFPGTGFSLLGRGCEEINPGQEDRRRQQEQEDFFHQRDQGAADQNNKGSSIVERGEGNAAFSEDDAINSYEIPMVAGNVIDSPTETAPQTPIEWIKKNLQQAVASGDINNKSFEEAAKKISELKQKNNALLNPSWISALWAWISSWWNGPAAFPSQEELAAAREDRVQLLWLEVSLPAWKEDALAVSARDNFDKTGMAKPVLEKHSRSDFWKQALTCWGFWKKVPANQGEDYNLKSAQIAWEIAEEEFTKQMPQERASFSANEKKLWENASKELKQSETRAKIMAADLEYEQRCFNALASYATTQNSDEFEKALKNKKELYEFVQEIAKIPPTTFTHRWSDFLNKTEASIASWNCRFHRAAAIFENTGARDLDVSGLVADQEKLQQAIAQQTTAISTLKIREEKYRALIPATSLSEIERERSEVMTESKTGRGRAALANQDKYYHGLLKKFDDQREYEIALMEALKLLEAYQLYDSVLAVIKEERLLGATDNQPNEEFDKNISTIYNCGDVINYLYASVQHVSTLKHVPPSRFLTPEWINTIATIEKKHAAFLKNSMSDGEGTEE